MRRPRTEARHRRLDQSSRGLTTEGPLQKAHVATDDGAGLIRGVEVTTANVHDAAKLEAVLPPEPGNVYADSAFGGDKPWKAIRARGGMPQVVQTGT